MNARVKLSIEDAADIVYATLPKGWRKPVVDEIAAQDEREERRRDADEHPGASNTDNDWEG
jgi:hypothetical protein